MADEPEIIRDNTNKYVDVTGGPKVKHRVRGLPRDKALDIFQALVDLGFACSVKHLGGYYFVEVPVGLIGDPCYLQNAAVQQIAFQAGAATLQTGETLRVIG
jgi:hypothetical protein